MKRFLLLLFVALFTIAVLLFIYNPQILENVWLWIVGLIGPIIAAIKSIVEWFKNLFKEEEKETTRKQADPQPGQVPTTPAEGALQSRIARVEAELKGQQKMDTFTGTTLHLLRYSDDGQATLSLLFYDTQFFCYALEDTFHPVKIPGETRIPAGTYTLGFNASNTELTQKYRQQYPWFTYHLELKDVPNYTAVYLHVGNYHHDTEGCILIADGIGTNNSQAMITHSRQAYQRLYAQVHSLLSQGLPARIIIRDESWFAQKLSS